MSGIVSVTLDIKWKYIQYLALKKLKLIIGQFPIEIKHKLDSYF